MKVGGIEILCADYWHSLRKHKSLLLLRRDTAVAKRNTFDLAYGALASHVAIDRLQYPWALALSFNYGLSITKRSTQFWRALEFRPVDRKRFEKLVEEAIERLPEVFRAKLANLAIFVEDLPPRESGRDGLLLGLFHGVPRTEKSSFQATPPDRIFLYQKNIEAMCSTDEEVRREIRNTLLHEVGHYFGLTEDELRGV